MIAWLTPDQPFPPVSSALESPNGLLAASAELSGVLVVSRDPHVRRLAARQDARVLAEAESGGHSAASSLGARALAREGAAAMIQVPADIPLMTPDDIAALVRAHGEGPAITLAPSRDQLGTNAVVSSPPDVLPLRFGDDSFSRHLRLARARGIEPQIVQRPGLALDVDTPADLAAFLAAPAQTRTHAYLAESGIAARLGAPGSGWSCG